MDWLLEKMVRYPRLSTTVIVLTVLIASGFIWWRFIWVDPKGVFEGMLANDLTTTSVTKVASASANGQTVDQYARLEMGSTNAVDWLVTARQTGSSVTTENIATPTTGYIRYTEIASSQRQANSKPYDFTKVLNIWAKSDGQTDPSLDHLFSQTLFDISSAPIPPIGNLSPHEQQNILGYIQSQHIFAPDYGTVKHETVNGRTVDAYTVSVQLAPYIRMMQAFAHDLGMKNLDTIDPNQYSTVAPIQVVMSVDVASHELARVSYAPSGFAQDYTDWGLLTPVTLPTHTISTTELQSRLQALGS